MSIIEKLKKRTSEIASSAVSGVTSAIADPEVKSKRIEICVKCTDLIPVFNVCKNCGCQVYAKSSLANSSCPLGKW